MSIPSWLEDISSNRFNQSYMKNFLDISGNLIIRNGSLTISNGNISYRNLFQSGSTYTNTQNITINSGGGSNGIIGNTINVNSTAIIRGNVFTNYNSQFTNTNISVNGDAIFDGQLLNTNKFNTSVNSGVFLLGNSNRPSISNGPSTVSIPNTQSNTAIVSGVISNTTGIYNVSMGNSPMTTNTIGSYNTAIGLSSLGNNTTGMFNSTVGYFSGAGYSNGSSNTIIGTNSGSNTTSGSRNTMIGSMIFGSGFNNSTTIGYNTMPTASNQIIFGRTTDVVYTSGLVTIGTISTSSTYKLNVSGSSGSYFVGNIIANNISINNGLDLFKLLKSINTGFVITGTYAGNYTSNAYFSINGFQQNMSATNSILVGCNSCIAYYYYISCKTSPTSVSTPQISIQNGSLDMGGSPINIITNQLTYDGPLSPGNSTNNIGLSLTSSSNPYSNRLNVLFKNGTAGGTLWKISILCQYI